MGKALVIVESEAKSKTINRFLGKDYVVKASIGHIKNLPKNRLGVDVDNGFEPEYITIRGRGKVLKELKRIAGVSDRIYIATDPDREGEAIAHHLSTEIQSSNSHISRVLFYEITRRAIQEAIDKPLDVDQKKVEAQIARRVMDRLVGYQVSPFLWKTLYRGLSAGRVQSVALRLLCERETEISEFVTREYWSIEADFETRQHERFGSKLIKISGRDAEIADESEAGKHVERLNGLEFVVSNVDEQTVRRNPYPPYTTSTLQQDGARRLNMTTKRIMAIAQQLYEGIDLPEGRVGLITYMRTDSTRIAPSAVEQTRQYIADNYGLKYVPDKPRFFKNRKSAQDAHEAIRPTSLKRTPKSVASYLTPAQQKLYLLIWNRFVACQMASAKLKQTVIDLTAGDYLFRSTGSIILFKGFMQIWEEMETEETKRPVMPEKITKGESVRLLALYPRQHFTKPPARYNESSLVRELDRLGIGRPSTYALIISTLLDRHYVERENRSLKSTDLGMAVNHILVHQFPDIFNVDFTARMEEELDQIETGEKDRVQVVRDFYGSFMQDMNKAMEKKEAIRESLQDERDEQCPQCGSDLVVKWGRNGRFIACTGYPDCKYTRPLEKDAIEVDEVCEKCGASMAVKVGRYGRFLACSNYPECKHTQPFFLGIACPKKDCGGRLIERKSRRGKLFYGCSNYPACQFATWNRPVARNCPKCQYAVMEEKSTKARGRFLQCPQCKHIIQEEAPE